MAHKGDWAEDTIRLKLKLPQPVSMQPDSGLESPLRIMTA